MADWRTNVDLAIQHQLFRRVAVDTITERGDLPFPPAGTEQQVADAVAYANANQVWLQIGQQLAYLKDSNGFLGTYVGKPGPLGAFHLVTAEAWSGNITSDFAMERLGWVWSIFAGLAKLVPDFKLPQEGQLRDAVRQAATAATPEAMQPYLGVAGSLANLLLSISESSGAALGALLLVDTDGASEQLIGEFESYGSKFLKTDPWSLHTHRLSAVLVDLRGRKAHAHLAPGLLDLGSFNSALKGAQW